ncbi:MAG: SHOCT domain-containing protein [Spirochaetia bacterium]
MSYSRNISFNSASYSFFIFTLHTIQGEEKMMTGWNTCMGWGFGGGLFSIILIVGAIIGIVFLVQWLIRKNGSTYGETREEETRPSAEEILKRRYARGEISREEYLNLKSDLEGEER